ncbi:hypothetical protein [Variovorax dokdonensis]|uniref:hypothetical protein n=1 Tax=Variovorax dokdonensis TaxID=344883 RepID=UPI0036F322E0
MTTALDLRTHAALYEAGQAVARFRLGLEPVGLSIVPIIKPGVEEVSANRRCDVDMESARVQIVCLLAGNAAQQVAGIPRGKTVRVGDDDLEEVHAIADLWGLERELRSCKARATRMMREPTNAQAVFAIANCLLARDEISAEMTVLLIHYADGDCSDPQMLESLLKHGWLDFDDSHVSVLRTIMRQLISTVLWRTPSSG